MVPYLLLVLLPLLFGYVAWGKTKENTRALYIGSSSYVQERSLAIPVFFLFLFLMLALRDQSIGRDLTNYRYFFEFYAEQDVRDLLVFAPDALYWLLCWAVGQVTESYQWFLVIVAAMTIIPMALLYMEERRQGFLQVIVFLNLSTFAMLFSGLRQSLAMVVGMIAYRYVRQKRFVPFLVIVMIAVGFHHSGFILILMYPLYHVTFRKGHMLFVVPVIGLIFVFNKPIFAAATAILSRFADEYEAEISRTGAFTMIILFALFVVFCYLVSEEEKLGKEGLGMRNFLLFALVVQCFAPLNSLAMRMGYYYMLFIPILLAKTIEASKEEYRQVARFGGYAMCGFFALYYLWGVYEGCTTGISSLDTMPYVPFWRG